MARIDLNVPFAEKDEAKALGARWDGTRRVWYVPDGVGPAAFGRWLPELPNCNVRAHRYYIGESVTSCWKCGGLTRVYGIYLPPGHATFEPGEDDDIPDSWYWHDAPTVLHYVEALLPAVAARVGAVSRHYRVDFSKTTNSAYWMNHCEACGMKQGDFDLFNEPGGAFFPTDALAASGITLHACAGPFGARAGTVYGDHFFDCMRRA